MMRIDTAAMGCLEIKPDQIYLFPKGLPGFEDELRFAVIPVEDSDFCFLQSLTQKELAFVLADPFSALSDYEFKLSEADKAELDLHDQVRVYGIVTLRTPMEESTINLLAPLVLSPAAGIAKQIVLHHSEYSARHPLFASDRAKEEV
ncbi:flagellar assembly protein FliW [Paenibacillus sp. D51F]